jgi:chemotaxis protein MotB
MATLSRRRLRTTNIWPGFVDALSQVLMVVIFLVMIFVLAQFFLSQALTGREEALVELRGQVEELATLLSLERRASTDLRANLTQLSADLQSSIAARDELSAAVRSMSERAASSNQEAQELRRSLLIASERTEADRVKLEEQSGRLADLARDVAALEALKGDLEREIAELGQRAEASEGTAIKERELSESARAQVALLNRQLVALREQVTQLNAALEASETKAREQRVEIANLGERLNAALATKVQELARYRSEFFGRLREVLGNRPNIRIVGDRFIFQSEVLFPSGSAEIGSDGEKQLVQVAQLITELAEEIPSDIDWVLQVNGHTDPVPIATGKYASNWELSAARAIAVVRLFTANGIPPTRLAAAGFAEFNPMVEGDTEEARRRNRRIELKLTES